LFGKTWFHDVDNCSSQGLQAALASVDFGMMQIAQSQNRIEGFGIREPIDRTFCCYKKILLAGSNKIFDNIIFR
jgi:hypothetical protein